MYVGCSDLFSVQLANGGFRFNCDNTEIEFLAHKITVCEFFLKIGLVIDFQKYLDGALIHINDAKFDIVWLSIVQTWYFGRYKNRLFILADAAQNGTVFVEIHINASGTQYTLSGPEPSVNPS